MQGVDDGVDDRRRGPDRARFARALYAQRIGLAWNVAGREREEREVVRARHLVVAERPRQQLAVALVVDCALVQRLADPLDDAAVHLAFEHERIDDGAEVVDDGVAVDAHHPAVRIDLHLDDVAAVGKVLADRVCTWVVSSPGSSPGGSLAGSCATVARLRMSIARSVPAMRNVPSSNSMSAADASSTWAAIRRPCR